MQITETLSAIQAKLKAPKSQFNAFGKYKYRSLEDIFEGLKPLLSEHKAAVTIQDEMVQVGQRIYVKAAATLHCGGEQMTVTAYAREAENKKGMDESQVTGSTSSYARKYAMNGLFAIDDTKDADATNQHNGNGNPKPANAKPDSVIDPEAIQKMVHEINDLNVLAAHYEARREAINKAANKDQINTIYAKRKKELQDADNQRS